MNTLCFRPLVSCIALLFVFVCCDNSGRSKDTFTIKTSITGLEDEAAVLQYFDRTERETMTLDSALIDDGSFTFEGTLESPRQVIVTTKPSGLIFSFFAENGIITISGDTADVNEDWAGRKVLNVNISGSDIQKDADSYEQAVRGIEQKMEPFSAAYDSLNRAYIAAKNSGPSQTEIDRLEEKTWEAKKKLDQFSEAKSEITETFIAEHPKSHFAASLYVWRTNSHTYDENARIFEKFSTSVQNGFYGRQIREELESLKKASPGAKVHDFKTVDINGDSLVLNDYRGQYVLLDFWASWCKPCRAGNPHLLELYKKYHDRGFEIIGISDDDSNPDAWRQAVAQDGIGVWKHVLRGLKIKRDPFEILDGGISEHYAIHTLPTKILINPKGMIIGRYGGGGEDDKAMDRKLKQIFEM